MALQINRLQALLHAFIDQGLGRSLPHDAVAALHDEVSALEEETPEPVDPYAGKSDAELLQAAQQGDKGALDRYVQNQNAAPAPASAPAAASEPVAPTVAAGEGLPPA